uniref:Uncharacterized protein n=1 Tax=Timema tahoe TaxID=61484 RepID=A0A7R9IG82_9NEOP|nr:unnamed protein product [Timema tahoe]
MALSIQTLHSLFVDELSALPWERETHIIEDKNVATSFDFLVYYVAGTSKTRSHLMAVSGACITMNHHTAVPGVNKTTRKFQSVADPEKNDRRGTMLDGIQTIAVFFQELTGGHVSRYFYLESTTGSSCQMNLKPSHDTSRHPPSQEQSYDIFRFQKNNALFHGSSRCKQNTEPI